MGARREPPQASTWSTRTVTAVGLGEHLAQQWWVRSFPKVLSSAQATVPEHSGWGRLHHPLWKEGPYLTPSPHHHQMWFTHPSRKVIFRMQIFMNHLWVLLFWKYHTTLSLGHTTLAGEAANVTDHIPSWQHHVTDPRNTDRTQGQWLNWVLVVHRAGAWSCLAYRWDLLLSFPCATKMFFHVVGRPVASFSMETPASVHSNADPAHKPLVSASSFTAGLVWPHFSSSLLPFRWKCPCNHALIHKLHTESQFRPVSPGYQALRQRRLYLYIWFPYEVKGWALCASKQSLRGPNAVPPFCVVSPHTCS